MRVEVILDVGIINVLINSTHHTTNVIWDIGQCDIPAHNYAYSFAPNPSWANYYATSAEIHAYMKSVAAQYNCEKYIEYNHTVRSAVWQEHTGKWCLTVVANGKEFVDVCDVVINAGGVLSNWEWPNIPGIENFKGKLMHSADWDTTYDWKSKNIAVVGIGSSGIQILPQVAKGLLWSPWAFCNDCEALIFNVCTDPM